MFDLVVHRYYVYRHHRQEDVGLSYLSLYIAACQIDKKKKEKGNDCNFLS
jgi:hypothetical protein